HLNSLNDLYSLMLNDRNIVSKCTGVLGVLKRPCQDPVNCAGKCMKGMVLFSSTEHMWITPLETKNYNYPLITSQFWSLCQTNEGSNEAYKLAGQISAFFCNHHLFFSNILALEF